VALPRGGTEMPKSSLSDRYGSTVVDVYQPIRPVVRLAMGVAIVAAVAAQLQWLHANGLLRTVNYFSFFTIDSNILAAVVLLAIELPSDTLPGRAARWLRGPMTLYMTMTGIIYAVLLAPIAADVSTQLDWVNTVVHVVGPIVVVADWFLAPPERRPSRTDAAWWLVFPVVWLGYSLVRGAIVDWYPYPFMDPRDGVEHAAGSWGAVIVTIAILTMFVIALALAIQWVTARARTDGARHVP
jgi:hypothetical protein